MIKWIFPVLLFASVAAVAQTTCAAGATAPAGQACVCYNGSGGGTNTCPAMPTGITTSDNYQTFQGTVMDTTFPTQTGTVRTVDAGGCTGGVGDGATFLNFLNSSQPGDTIVLHHGCAYAPTTLGGWQLPNKTTNPSGQWIMITSDTYSSLPLPGVRVSPADAVNMAKITYKHHDTGGGPALTYPTWSGDNSKWWIVGIEFYPDSGVQCTYSPAIPSFVQNCLSGELIMVGGPNIVLDRDYIHGMDGLGTDASNSLNRQDVRHAVFTAVTTGDPSITVNTNLAVINSYLSQIHADPSSDTNAFSIIRNYGVTKIVNNYISSSGEGFMSGGVANTSTAHIGNQELRYNYFRPDPKWIINSIGTISTISRTNTTIGTVSSISRTKNKVTATLTAPPPASTIIAGSPVTVSLVSDTTFNGSFVLTSVSGSTLTWTQTAADAGPLSGGTISATVVTATLTASPSTNVYPGQWVNIGGWAGWSSSPPSVADPSFNQFVGLTSVSGSTLTWVQTNAANASSTGGDVNLDLTWQKAPTSVSVPWTGTWLLKDNFECKDGFQTLFTGNILDGAWAGGFNNTGSSEHGQSIRLNVHTYFGDAKCNDYTVAHNIIRESNTAITHTPISSSCNGSSQYNAGLPCYYPGQAIRELIYDNLWIGRPVHEPGGSGYGVSGQFYQVGSGEVDAVLSHNTTVYPDSYQYAANSANGTGIYFNRQPIPVIFASNVAHGGTGYKINDTGNICAGTVTYTVTKQTGNITISSIVRASNVVTATLLFPALPALINATQITVAGVSNTTFNGSFTVSSVSGNTVTWAQTAANASSTGGNISLSDVAGWTTNPNAGTTSCGVTAGNSSLNVPTTTGGTQPGVGTGFAVDIYGYGEATNLWMNNNVLHSQVGGSSIANNTNGGVKALQAANLNPSTPGQDLSYRFTGNLMGAFNGWNALSYLGLSTDPTCNGLGDTSCKNLASSSTSVMAFNTPNSDCVTSPCDYSLVTPYYGSDGTPSGVLMDLLNQSTRNVVTGVGVGGCTPTPIITSPTTLPNAAVGETYSYILVAGCGSGTYTSWAASPVLTNGLSLSTGGVISGTATAPSGTISTAITVTDSASNTSAPVTFSIPINPRLAFVTASLPNGAPGQPYNVTLQITGGIAPFTYSVVSGTMSICPTLSNGVCLNANNGTISGTPTTVQVMTFSVQVADSQVNVQQTYTLTVAAVLSITTVSPLPAGTATVAYAPSGSTFSFSGTGGVAPYSWSVITGSLPSGMTLASNGQLTGTPASTGTFSFTIQMADSNTPPNKTSAPFVLPIQSFTPAITITTTSLATGSISAPYTTQLNATGGVLPYTWTVVGGALPGWASMNASGAISGTPNLIGTTNLIFRVQDSAGSSVTSTTLPLVINSLGGSGVGSKNAVGKTVVVK